MSFDHLRDVCSAARSLSFQLNYSTAPDIHNLLLPVLQPAPAISLFWSAKIFTLWSPKPWPALVHPWWLVEPEGQEEEASSCWYGGSGWEKGGFRSLMICEERGLWAGLWGPLPVDMGVWAGWQPSDDTNRVNRMDPYQLWPGSGCANILKVSNSKEREGAMTPRRVGFVQMY